MLLGNGKHTPSSESVGGHSVESVSDLKTVLHGNHVVQVADGTNTEGRNGEHSDPNDNLLDKKKKKHKKSSRMRDPHLSQSKSGFQLRTTAKAIKKHFLRQFAREKHMMLQHYHVVFFGAVFQYVHSVSTNIAYVIHEPREVLYDIGFATIPALSLQVISEILFFMLLFSTIFFAVSPFFSFVNTTPHSARPRANSKAPPLHPEHFYHLYNPNNNHSNNASPAMRPVNSSPHDSGSGRGRDTRSARSGSERSPVPLLDDVSGNYSSEHGSSPVPSRRKRSPMHLHEQPAAYNTNMDYLSLPPTSDSGLASPTSPGGVMSGTIAGDGSVISVIGASTGAANNAAIGTKPNDVILRPFYSTLMLSRFLSVLVICQSLRITCFLVTSLPGPNYHCRPGSESYDPPSSFFDIFLRQDALYGCGDLVFSSHTIFISLCCLTYWKYGRNQLIKKALAVLLLVFAVLVIAARKHYSLDVVVALYTVPLVWTMYDRYYPDLIHRTILLMEFNQYRARLLSAQIEEEGYDVIEEGTAEHSSGHEDFKMATMAEQRLERFNSAADLEAQVQGFARDLNFEVDEEAIQLAVQRMQLSSDGGPQSPPSTFQ